MKIQQFPLKKMGLKMSAAKWRPFHLGLNVISECHDTSHELSIQFTRSGRYNHNKTKYSVSVIIFYGIYQYLIIIPIVLWYWIYSMQRKVSSRDLILASSIHWTYVFIIEIMINIVLCKHSNIGCCCGLD